MSNWRQRLWGAAAISLLMLGVVGTAYAAAEDYAVDSREWNGLAEFVELGEASGVEVRSVDILDWREVESTDLVVWIYPERSIDVASSAEFLIDGGRMLIADDFGRSEPLLQRLAVERQTPSMEQLPHHRFVDDHRGWPIFSVEGMHPLLEGVEELVANYPAVVQNVGGPVVAYDDGGGLVYDMMLGDGRAVVLADPGLFINSMLPAADNRRFAKNLWSYLCSDVADCRAWLVVRSFDVRGEYGQQGPLGDDLRDRIEGFNEKLRDVFEELGGTQFLYFLALFLAIGSLAYLLVVFPWRRFVGLSEYIDRHREDLSPPSTEFDWNVERFSDPEGPMNYTLPMAILKESFDEFFLGAFDLWPSKPDERPSVRQLVHRFEERYLRGQPPQVRRKRRNEVEALLIDLNGVPERHHVFLESDESFSLREMRRFYRRMIRVLSWMDLQESYERRTSEINTGTRP